MQSLVVSIPQAVGTIAIKEFADLLPVAASRFNTASGRYYCNFANKLQR